MFKSFFLIFAMTSIAYGSEAVLKLPLSVYSKIPFSSQFMEDGALIRNINYDAVKRLVPQIEKLRGIKLTTRGESHITVISPPEAKGWFHPSRKGVDSLISWKELHRKYFNTLQSTKFTVKCIGESMEGDKHVFFLIVTSPELRAIRADIQDELESRAKFSGMKTHFDAGAYEPHITIGYIGGDVFSNPKTKCVEDIVLNISK